MGKYIAPWEVTCYVMLGYLGVTSAPIHCSCIASDSDEGRWRALFHGCGLDGIFVRRCFQVCCAVFVLEASVACSILG